MHIPKILSGLIALSFFGMTFAPALVNAATPGTVSFSGYTWNVRSGTGKSNPGPNVWDGSSNSVYVDSAGQLHLKILNQNGVWSSSEVWLPSSLGYGTYQFTISSRLDTLDTNVVASPFLYQDDTHEFDTEFSNWQSPGSKQGQFVVQPSWIDGQGEVAGNVSHFALTSETGDVVDTMTWTPDGISFSAVQNGKTLGTWSYDKSKANFFTPGGEELHINLWQIDGLAPSNKQTQELVVKNFTFTPQGSSSSSGGSDPTNVPLYKPHYWHHRWYR